MKFLTPEDKKILRTTSRYLQSVDLNYGLIDFYLDGSSISSYIPLSVSSFSNSYNVLIPEFLHPLIDRLLTQFEEEIDYFDVVNLNYSRFEINIDTQTMSIIGTKYWSYMEEGSSDGTSWDMESDSEELTDIFNELDNLETEEDELRLNYDGSGDSGYIESRFESGYSVPKIVEDWCYDSLEREHGGWEINEGSSGYFIFDLKNKTISLEHTFNEETHKEDTIFEESFNK